ncbi:hypothetical protein OWR28_17390 [Chryseobacterium sp. 1B4]
MKENYNFSINLRCQTCGNSDFEYNEDRTWVKCNNCNREYNGGYDELVEANKSEINDEVSRMKNEVTKDLQKDINKMLKNAFSGNKNIRFK